MLDDSEIDFFFRTYIEGWMLKSLRYCACVTDENLSFVVAASVFNAVDFLSLLWEPKRKPDKDRFEGCLIKFFKPKYKAKNLYDHYRSGLNHEYFPKQGSAVAWNKPEAHLQLENGALCLNAQDLVADLAEAFGNYRKELQSEEYLRNNFEIRAKQLGWVLKPGVLAVSAEPNNSSSAPYSPGR